MTQKRTALCFTNCNNIKRSIEEAIRTLELNAPEMNKNCGRYNTYTVQLGLDTIAKGLRNALCATLKLHTELCMHKTNNE